MPTRPNRIDPHYDLAAITADEGETMTTADIDLNGYVEIRVDCDCNAHHDEHVRVPYVLAYEALIDGRTADAAELRADPRIVSMYQGGQVGRPSKDFKPVHVATAIQTMRNRRRIPFSPLVKQATFDRLMERQAFAEWRAGYLGTVDTELEPPDGWSMSADATAYNATERPPAGLGDQAAPGTISGTVADLAAITPAVAAESAVEMARGFPVDGSVDEIVDWVAAGEVAERGPYALALEKQRRKTRVSLLERLLELAGADTEADDDGE